MAVAKPLVLVLIWPLLLTEVASAGNFRNSTKRLLKDITDLITNAKDIAYSLGNAERKYGNMCQCTSWPDLFRLSKEISERQINKTLIKIQHSLQLFIRLLNNITYEEQNKHLKCELRMITMQVNETHDTDVKLMLDLGMRVPTVPQSSTTTDKLNDKLVLYLRGKSSRTVDPKPYRNYLVLAELKKQGENVKRAALRVKRLIDRSTGLVSQNGTNTPGKRHVAGSAGASVTANSATQPVN